MAKLKTQKQIDALFVQAVSDIRHFYINQSDADTPSGRTSEAFAALSERDQLDARLVATALLVFNNYLVGSDRDHLGRVQQLWLLLNLFDAITCGTPGPFFRYISNVKKSGADYATQERRSFFVGLVLALKQAASFEQRRLTRPAAVKEANKLCGLSFTSTAVDKWIERGQVTQSNTWRDRLFWTSSGEDDDRTFTKRVKDNGRDLFAGLDAAPEPLPFGP
jgi:hypothetical protein